MAVWTLASLLSAAGCGSGAEALRFETLPVEQGPVVAKVTASGTLSALVTVQVGSQVSGRIKEILADFNTLVTRGQVVARIDPQLFQAAVQQAQANYEAAAGELTKAEVQARDAERQWTRAKSLFEQKLIAQAEADTAQATALAAAAQVAALRGRLAQTGAALHQARINLTYTEIVSPINGSVISRNVDVGQTVAASLQAPTLFVIAEDLKKMQVNTSVAEADIGKLRDGMTALFTVDAYPNEQFAGRVRQIRNAPQTVQNVVTYDAVIDVDNGELKLKPGMTANVSFVYAERTNALRLANAALRFRPSPELLKQLKLTMPSVTADKNAAGPQNQRVVWLATERSMRAVAVQIGITDGSVTEIVQSELNEGDRVVTAVQGGPKAAGSSASGPPGMGGGGGSGGLRRAF